MTVNSARDKNLPPQTYTFALEPAVRGSLQTDIELAQDKPYDIYVSTVDADGRPSESVLVEPAGPVTKRKPWQRPLLALGRLVARLRGKRTPETRSRHRAASPARVGGVV